MPSSSLPSSRSSAEGIEYALAGITDANFISLSVLMALTAVFLGNVIVKKKRQKAHNIPFVLYTGSAETDAELFQAKASEMVNKGRKEHPDSPFFINNDMGPYLILPSRLAHVIRNTNAFNFAMFLKDYYHNGAPGFEPFIGASREDKLFQAVSRKRLTNSLNRITVPLSQEASFALDLQFGTSTEWKEHTIHPIGLDIIARVSSRVLLGEELCRNTEWLEVTKNYTVKGFIAAEVLKQKPKILRGIYNRFDPMCVELRRTIDRARQLIGPVVEERRRMRKEAMARGDKVPSFNDSIDWIEEEAAGNPYDPVLIQMTISTSSIHSTTDLLVKTMYKIAEHPGLDQELRDEIVQALRPNGWKKTALYDLKLLDSVIKETQRLEPLTLVTMNRFTERDVTLPDGTFIPKGTRVGTDTSYRVSPEFYEDPLKFDPYRYARWRGTDKDSIAHLVSTSPQSLGFGHGQHACPGRFFTANELKIILCHLLIKYDFRLVDGSSYATMPLGLLLNVNPTTRLMVRRRKEVELSLDSL
ncbi:hypothetical protein MCOR02_005192 [Pyricularia oryzae]|nr:hypothetical protein MCOR02_005192 [Pyricularia oryzae]KAI6554886.1 hypothetical protein MCOR04_010522 [Pyricularia oryzae]